MRLLLVVGEAEDQARAAAAQLSSSHEVAVLATGAFEAPEAVRMTRFERPGALLEQLHREARSHDAILFFGSEHESCAQGVGVAPERAALVPAVRDPMALEERAAQALFHLPRALGFQNAAEESLVRARFRNGRIPGLLLDEDGALERLLALVSA